MSEIYSCGPHKVSISQEFKLTVSIPLAVVVSLLAMIEGAAAQTAGIDDPTAKIEEVVVTARRREESQLSVPIAISVLDDAYLENAGIDQVADLRLHVPSFSVSVAGASTNTPIFSLRGQRVAETILTLDSSIPIYFAEVAVTPTQGTNLAMYDMRSVEVLKGPQGTLFGRNSTGGALLLNPRLPGDNFEGFLTGEVGNYNRVRLHGAVDIPISSDHSLRIAGNFLQRDGYQNNLAENALAGDDKFWDADEQGVRVSWRGNFGSKLSNTLIASYDQSETLARVPSPLAFRPNAPIGSLVNLIHNGGLGFIGAPDVDQAVARLSSRSWQDAETDLNATEDLDQTMIVNTTELELSNGLLMRNIFGYRDLDLANSGDVDGTALPIFGSQTSLSDPVTLSPPLATIRSEQFSNELQVLGELQNGLSWIVGTSWYQLDGEQTAPSQIIGGNPDWPPIPPPAPSLGPVWFFATNGYPQDSPAGDVKNTAYSVFGEADVPLGKDVTLTLGARQSWDEREVTVSNTRLGQCNVSDAQGNLLPADNCARTESESFSEPTWRVALRWEPSDGLNIYGSASTGYRTGGFNLRGTDNFSLTPFNEETVLNLEGGLKFQSLIGEGSVIRGTVAIYSQRYDDIQKTQPVFADGNFGTATVNAAEGTINGLEMEFGYGFQDLFSASMSYAYVDAGYDEWLLAAADGSVQDISSRPFTWIPENSLSLNASLTLFNSAIGRGELSVHYYWQSEVFASDKEPFETAEQRQSQTSDSYDVFDFRLSWLDAFGSSIALAAFINNAGDTEYGVGGLNVLQDLGWAARVYGEPRTYGLSVSYRF